MTPLASLWVATTAGALLFFLGGLLWGRRHADAPAEALRRAAAWAGELETERADLRAQNRELAAQISARAAPPGDGRDLQAGLSAAALAGAGLGPALQEALQKVCAGRVRAAVLADRQGLLVASSGEHAEALAAFGALLLEAAARAHDVLPLRSAERVCVQDEHQVTVAVRPLVLAGADLALVTLEFPF